MKSILFIALLSCAGLFAQAQKIYQTKSGKIAFFSSTPAEDIEAVNNQADAKLATNGQMTFKVLIKGFTFRNAKMQEHFNENYMESDQFPKASFMGKIDNLSAISFEKEGTYQTKVTGILEIHGVKKTITVTGYLKVAGNTLQTMSKFTIQLADFGIKGNYIGEKIAKTIEITVDCKYN
jgi:polyisoprenoid-binding protein YceI